MINGHPLEAHVECAAQRTGSMVSNSAAETMATREKRLSEFTTDREPPSDLAVQVLCQDHVGTYALPFLCRYDDQCWRNVRTGEQIEADVIGWRMPAS